MKRLLYYLVRAYLGIECEVSLEFVILWYNFRVLATRRPNSQIQENRCDIPTYGGWYTCST